MALLIDELMPPIIVCDSFKLSQVVANLLNNAIKYAYRDSTVILRLNRFDISTWTIQVINKGIGIAQEKLTAIFEQFVTDKQNRHTEGTGLGLFIVKNMINALEGSINVESQIGGDTTFTVRLKLQPGSIEYVQEEAEEEEIDLSSIHVLVADDNEMNNMLFSKYLSMCGCTVVSVSNGLEVLYNLKNGKQLPDIILLDHQMPEMDGAVTLVHLKKDPRLQRIPVIICTGSTDFRESLMAAGASAVMVKPIDQKSLFNAISKHLPEIS